MTWMILTAGTAYYRWKSHDTEPGETYSMTREPALRPHIEEWVRTNIIGEWEVRCKEYGRSKETGEIVWWENHPEGKADRRYDWYGTIAIQFESDDDAALFKLMWL